MKRGFTLPELIVVMAILAVLTALTTVNLLRPQHQASTTAAVAPLMADLRQQQLQAMLGITAGSGIFLAVNQYTLNPGNFSVLLESPIRMSTTFPNSQIVFQAGSGEVAGANTITITNPNGPTATTLTINRYGTVESVD